MAKKGTNSCKKAKRERAARKAREGRVVAADRRDAHQRMEKAGRGRNPVATRPTLYGWG